MAKLVTSLAAQDHFHGVVGGLLYRKNPEKILSMAEVVGESGFAAKFSDMRLFQLCYFDRTA